MKPFNGVAHPSASTCSRGQGCIRKPKEHCFEIHRLDLPVTIEDLAWSSPLWAILRMNLDLPQPMFHQRKAP